jgi:DNA (cytosine-5)-methyltransferase 1
VKSKIKLKVLDLFCGAGGFSYGFKSAGFEIVAGIDRDLDSLKTFSKNFPKAKIFQEDLSEISIDLRRYLLKNKNEIDVIVGGPPCQGFSIAGKRFIDDPRNSLYKHYIETVRIVKPKYVVIENVPNILTMGEGKISKAIESDLEQLGYKVKIVKVNAADFGVPQNRRRVFFIAKLRNLPIGFPDKTEKNQVLTTSDAISDLPILEGHFDDVPTEYVYKAKNKFQRRMRAGSKKINNHWSVAHTDQTKSIISLVPDGGNYKDLPKKLQKTRRVNIAWTRMASNKPSFTIDAGHNHHFHYEANRVPTVRESARIQTFPDKFIFLGSKTSQLRQVGNAVPPLLAEILARNIYRDLK